MSRRLRAVALAGVVAATLPSSAVAAERLRLPTPRDAVAIAQGAETIFFGADGVETILPGTISDEEVVEVGLGLDGAVRRVVVTQRLVIEGLGDFQFKIPGPAQSVEPLPESENPPGLRRGSVLWQGFSPGRKVLAARMPLFPGQEAGRLPIGVDLSITVDGQPLVAGEPASGELEIVIELRNISEIPITIVSADVAPEAVARALDAVDRALRAGRRPVPGEAGVPESLVGAPGTGEIVGIEAPFEVDGTLRFPPGTVSGLVVEGGRAPGSDEVRFGALLGGGGPRSLEVRITGRARDLEVPELSLAGEPAPPRAQVTRPPGPSWSAAAAAGDAQADEMVQLLLETLWRSARLRQFDAYLGNPDPVGPASAAYLWTLAAPPGRGPAPEVVVTASGPTMGGILALVLLVLLLALFLLVAWAHA